MEQNIFEKIAVQEQIEKLKVQGSKFLGVSVDEDLYTWLEEISQKYFRHNKSFAVNSILRNLKNKSK